MRKRGLIVFGAALMGLSAPHVGYAKPKGESQQGQTEASIANTLEDIASTYREQTKRAQADRNTEPCNAGDDRRYSDLCAQWKAADAANDAAFWGKLGFIVGTLSLIGVLGALGISIWSNLIIRKTAKHELRAYLGVSSIDAAPDGNGSITARIIVRNFGSTPAQNITSKVAGVVREFPSQTFDGRGPEPKSQICPATIHPGSEFDLFAGTKIRSIEALLDGDDGFYVYGSIEYDDFDGDHHETNFCYRGTQSTLVNKGQMRVSFEGNNAT